MKLKYSLSREHGTFSMVARCPKTLALGACVASGSLAVGSVVPHVEPSVGALAVQGYTNFFHGVNGLRLLREGYSPQEVIEMLLREDGLREMRQIILINSSGRGAAFTGKETPEWRGQIIGENYVAAGNLLSSDRVLREMTREFEGSEGEPLAERLMRALEAGEGAGGDRRGSRSAALIVAEREPIHESRPIIDLRVDLHEEPVKELRRIFDYYKNWLELLRKPFAPKSTSHVSPL
ncbi:MAG: DUF1028 domain-containing protein [Candidatus Bathyarchaeia archaeon]